MAVLTLSLRWTLAPAVRSDCVVATSPLSAEKKRADHPVHCDDAVRHTLHDCMSWICDHRSLCMHKQIITSTGISHSPECPGQCVLHPVECQ